MIDIKAVKEAAEQQMRTERAKKATEALVRQMKVVDTAEQCLRAEKLKLTDLEQQIADGTL